MLWIKVPCDCSQDLTLKTKILSAAGRPERSTGNSTNCNAARREKGHLWPHLQNMKKDLCSQDAH